MATTSQSAVHAPFAGTVIAIAHDVGEPVAAGAALVILEAMKMEHEVIAEHDGIVARVEVKVSAARSMPTALIRRPGSCSCATRMTCRCCSSATRPGSWSVRRPSAPPPSHPHKRRPHIDTW